MVKATPPVRIHCDRNNISPRKTRGFCLVKAIPTLAKKNTRFLCGKSYTSLRKTHGFCMAKAMSVIPVGLTYATYGGLTITAVTLFGVFKYNQVPNMYGIVGIVLIIIGVILLNTLGKTN